MRSVVALLTACCTALVLGPIAPTQARTSAIGYVYAGVLAPDTLHGGVKELAVRSDYTLAPIRLTTLPGKYVMGLALVHTWGGISLYALDLTASTGSGTIYQFTVNPVTGALTPKSPASVGHVGLPSVSTGNNLWVYDGYGENGSGASALYAVGCVDTGCIHKGLAHLKIDPRTGRLSLAAPVQNAYITNATLGGDHLGLLELDRSNYEIMAAGVINPATGSVRFGSSVRLPVYGLYIAASDTRLAVAAAMNSITAQNKNERLMVYPVSGNRIMPGKGTVAANFEQIYSMAFTSHYLLAGEWVPHFELFSQDGGTSLAWTALDAPPYNIDGGSIDVPSIPAGILCLGSGVYMGFSAGPILQATDGPGTKGFMINAAHPSLSVGNSQSMAGYLLTIDHPPVFYNIGNKTVQVGHILKFTVGARDPNAGDSLRYSASNLPRGATFNTATHTFKWTPNNRQVSVHRGVTFTATDNHRKSDSEVISITVRKRR